MLKAVTVLLAAAFLSAGCSSDPSDTAPEVSPPRQSAFEPPPSVEEGSVTPNPRQVEAERATNTLLDQVEGVSNPREQMVLVMNEFCTTWVQWKVSLDTGFAGEPSSTPSSEPYYVGYKARAEKLYDKAATDDWLANTESPGELPPLFSQIWPERCTTLTGRAAYP